MVLGLLFVVYINEIADGLERLTGPPVFDPSIYYFHKIPTIVDPLTVAWIVAGRRCHRGAGQRLAGAARGAAAPRGGAAL